MYFSDPEDLPMFSEEMCPSIEEYDDRSLDQEEMSETECDRDCIGIARQRKCKLKLKRENLNRFLQKMTCIKKICYLY